MKKYIDQFYSEGLATIFYIKPIKYLNKKVENKVVKRVLDIIIKILYTIIVIVFAGYVFYKKFPF